MATYKGIGFDNTNGKIRTGTASDSIQFNSQIDAQDGISATNGISSDTISTTGDASVGGDLTVTGDIIARDEVQLVVKDPMIDLGIGNSTTTATAGGYSLTMNRNSGFTAETITAQTAGVAATSAPTLTASAASNFSAGDVLCLTGSSEASNDGLYTVASVATNTITLEGIGGTAVSGSLPFSQNQVTTNTGDTASAFKIDIYVQAVADGTSNFNNASGGAIAKGTLIEVFQANATKSDFTANGSYQPVGSAALSTTLQDAYDNGGSITTASSTDIAFTLTSGNFTVDGGNMSLGGTSASNFNMDGGAFTAGLTTALSSFGVITNGNSGGDIVLSESGASGSIQMEVNSTTIAEAKAAAFDLNTNITLGKATGSAQSISKDGSAAAGDDLEIKVTGNQNSSLILQSEGSGSDAVKIQTTTNGGGIQIDSDGALDILSDDTTQLVMDANDAGAKTLTIQANNAGGGDAVISIDADNTVKIVANSQDQLVINSLSSSFGNEAIFSNTDGFSVNGEAVVITSIKDEDNMASDSANALATQQSIKAYVDSQITAQDLDIQGDSGTGSVDLDSQVLDIAGGTNITTTASNQEVSVALDANITLTSVTATTINASNFEANDSTSAMTIADTTGAVAISTTLGLSTGTTINEFSIDGSLGGNSDDAVPTEKAVKTYVTDELAAYQGLTVLGDGSGGALAAGDVVAMNSSGNAIQANATSASTARVIGICANNDSGTIFVQQIGNNTNVSGLTAGTTYYLDTSAGALTATAPTGSGNVVFQVGIARTASNLVVAPNFIMEIG